MNNQPFDNDIQVFDSSTTSHNFYKAPYIDRLMAIMVDNFLIGVGAKLIGELAKALGLGVLPTLLLALSFTFFYMIYCQSKWGQTLGKKLLKIKVININSGGYAGLKSIFIRETFGRTISTVFFGLGYIWPLFSKTGQAWHDSISKTQVVTLKSSRPNALVVIGGGLATVGSLIGIGFYVLFYTSAPISTVAKRFTMQTPLKINGVGGSIAKGITLESIQMDTPEATIDIQDTRIEIDVFNKNKKFDAVINEFSVGSATITSKECIQKKGKDLITGKNKKEPKPPTVAKKDKKFESLLISLIDINNVKITDGCMNKAFKISRIYVSNFKYIDKSLDIERTYLDAAQGTLNLPQVKFSKAEGIDMQQFGSLILKPHLAEIIKKDIPIQFKLKAKDKDLQELKLQAFQGRLVAEKLLGGDFAVESKYFTPSEYFNTASPVSQINIKAQGANMFALLFSLRGGNFYFANKKVIFDRNQAYLEKNPNIKFDFNIKKMFSSITKPEAFLHYPVSNGRVVNRRVFTGNLIYENNYNSANPNMLNVARKYSVYLAPKLKPPAMNFEFTPKSRGLSSVKFKSKIIKRPMIPRVLPEKSSPKSFRQTSGNK